MNALQAPELSAPRLVEQAYGDVVGSLVVVIDGLSHQIAKLEADLAERLEGHPDAEIMSDACYLWAFSSISASAGARR